MTHHTPGTSTPSVDNSLGPGATLSTATMYLSCEPAISQWTPSYHPPCHHVQSKTTLLGLAESSGCN